MNPTLSASAVSARIIIPKTFQMALPHWESLLLRFTKHTIFPSNPAQTFLLFLAQFSHHAKRNFKSLCLILLSNDWAIFLHVPVTHSSCVFLLPFQRKSIALSSYSLCSFLFFLSPRQASECGTLTLVELSRVEKVNYKMSSWILMKGPFK